MPLALATPHNLLGFLVAGLACSIAFAAGTVLRRTLKRPPPAWSVHLCWIGAAAGIGGALLVKTWDMSRMREQLRAVPASEVTSLALKQGKGARTVTDPAKVAEILGVLQSTESGSSHHGPPRNAVDIAFEFRGERYLYSVGQDADVPGEYWVVDARPGCGAWGDLEIGRFDSSTWEEVLRSLK